jgi:hypothetical protein
MSNYTEDDFIKKIEAYPLLKQYLGPSLLERFRKNNSFRNRIIQSIFRGGHLVKNIEASFENADLRNVINSQSLFSDLQADSFDYDLQLFDLTSEVSLIVWARGNGFKSIKKIPRGNNRTPDFILQNDGENVLAEVERLRARDYLVDFVYDSISAIFYQKVR